MFVQVILGHVIYATVLLSFYLTINPSLATQVYINASNVDDYLVESITRPAADPNAGEVYYRYQL